MQLPTEALGVIEEPVQIFPEDVIVTEGFDLTIIVCAADAGEIHPVPFDVVRLIEYVPGLMKLNSGVTDVALPEL